MRVGDTNFSLIIEWHHENCFRTYFKLLCFKRIVVFVTFFLLLLLIFQYLFVQVLSMMGDNPVIFAPSHRSYGDFILMSYLCFHYKIQIPAIAAGMGKQMHVQYHIGTKRCISYIYSTNTGTEYFKHGIYSPFLSLQNAACFIILTYLVPLLFTFYIQVC